MWMALMVRSSFSRDGASHGRHSRGDESATGGVLLYSNRGCQDSVNVSQANAKLLPELDLPASGKRQGQGRRRRNANVDPQAARLRPGQEMAARLSSSTAARRARGRTAGATAGTPNCGRRRATSSLCRIRAASPASARNTSTRSAATGAASATTTSWPGWITWRSSRTSTRIAWPRPAPRSAAT